MSCKGKWRHDWPKWSKPKTVRYTIGGYQIMNQSFVGFLEGRQGTPEIIGGERISQIEQKRTCKRCNKQKMRVVK